MNSSERAFAHEKYWLKRARVRLDRVEPAGCGLSAAPCGTALADIRIEDGVIRAVVPAGHAPCCCRGVDLEGGSVRPLHATSRLAPQAPADLHVTHARGGEVVLIAGKPDGPCTLCVECICTPPLGRG